jgi:predicted nucleotidyltransferase
VVSFLPAPDRPSFADFIELEAALAAATARKVDLIAAGSVRNPYVRASMDQDRVTVHEA